MFKMGIIFTRLPKMNVFGKTISKVNTLKGSGTGVFKPIGVSLRQSLGQSLQCPAWNVIPAQGPPAAGSGSFSCPYRGSCGPKRCAACCFHRLLDFLGRPWSGAGLHGSPTRAPSRPAASPGSTCRPRSGPPRRPGCGSASPPPSWSGPARSHSRARCGPRTACRRRTHRAESLVCPWGPGAAGRPCLSGDFRPTGCRDQILIFPCEIPNTETERVENVHFLKNSLFTLQATSTPKDVLGLRHQIKTHSSTSGAPLTCNQ